MVGPCGRYGRCFAPLGIQTCQSTAHGRDGDGALRPGARHRSHGCSALPNQRNGGQCAPRCGPSAPGCEASFDSAVWEAIRREFRSASATLSVFKQADARRGAPLSRRLTAPWIERKRWADPWLLNLCCLRSRRRIGRCEFSARLLCGRPPGAWRSPDRPPWRRRRRTRACPSRSPWDGCPGSSATCAATSWPPACCAAAGRACPAPRPRRRRPARGTSAGRRSSRPSRPNASGQSASISSAGGSGRTAPRTSASRSGSPRS